MYKDYSIVLRTLGKGGSKYQRLLASISKQTLKPKEFIVVIPNGYALPSERLGSEHFIRGKKGMVRQRLDGIEAATSEYVLLIDDDISFQPDFVQNLFTLLNNSNADAVSPKVREISTHDINPIKGFIRYITTGGHFSKEEHSYAIRISPYGGVIYQTNLSPEKTYLTESGHGGCCLISKNSLSKLKYEEELWLERDCTYAYPDDQVFFYKAHCIGLKIVFAHTYSFLHLDAGTAIADSTNKDKRFIKRRDATRNSLIFWHRFLYSKFRNSIKNKYINLIGMIWRQLTDLVITLLYVVINPHKFGYFTQTIKGLYLGIKYIHSEEYSSLPSISFSPIKFK